MEPPNPFEDCELLMTNETLVKRFLERQTECTCQDDLFKLYKEFIRNRLAERAQIMSDYTSLVMNRGEMLQQYANLERQYNALLERHKQLEMSYHGLQEVHRKAGKECADALTANVFMLRDLQDTKRELSELRSQSTGGSAGSSAGDTSGGSAGDTSGGSAGDTSGGLKSDTISTRRLQPITSPIMRLDTRSAPPMRTGQISHMAIPGLVPSVMTPSLPTFRAGGSPPGFSRPLNPKATEFSPKSVTFSIHRGSLPKK
jgi:hypothetical protein